MRFVAAIVSFVLAFIMIGLGIAQRTIFAEPDRVVATSSSDSSATVTLIPSAVFTTHEGRQRITASGTETVVAAYGREADVVGWIGDASHNILSIDEETGALDSRYVLGATREIPLAIGSDLWVGEYQSEGALELSLTLPAGYAMLVMSTGVDPAPSQVSLVWPVDNRTPWAGPLIVAGLILLLLGAGFYLWAILHLRRRNGPRRSQPKPPKQAKLPPSPRQKPREIAKAMRPGLPAPGTGLRDRRSRGNRMIAVPALLLAPLLLVGCTADSWPSASPSASAEATLLSEEPVEGAPKPPAVTEAQLTSIMSRVATAAAAADAETSDEVLATRFAGPALEVRLANYAKRRADAAVAPLPAIAAAPIGLALPQQTDAWPRIVMAVVQDPEDATVVPTALILVQSTPRENYKVNYAVALEALEDSGFPDVAAASVGAVRYGVDNKFLKLTPEQVATAYADVLAVGESSKFAAQFDLAHDSFLTLAGPDARAARAAAVTGPAALTTAPLAGTGERYALATDNTGAIVALNFGDTETVTPTEAGAKITVGTEVKLLTGVSETTKGVYANYGYQLLFYVPPAGSTEKIRLLGATQGIISAGEL